MGNSLTGSEWLRIRTKARQQWDELSDEDIGYIDGNWDKFAEKLRERYSFTKVQAEEEIAKFIEGFEIDRPLDLG